MSLNTETVFYYDLCTVSYIYILEWCLLPSLPQKCTAGLNGLLHPTATTTFPANLSILLITYLYCLPSLDLPFYAKWVHLLPVLPSTNSGKYQVPGSRR